MSRTRRKGDAAGRLRPKGERKRKLVFDRRRGWIQWTFILIFAAFVLVYGFNWI